MYGEADCYFIFVVVVVDLFILVFGVGVVTI